MDIDNVLTRNIRTIQSSSNVGILREGENRKQ
jgi:hypothetical protein